MLVYGIREGVTTAHISQRSGLRRARCPDNCHVSDTREEEQRHRKKILENLFS
jgi:hypothetical protein